MVTDRRKRLLQIIVDEYVRTAQPVASNALVEKFKLGVSSATVRNDMAALEEEGYIASPHTSAGRVPTDSGYRYYVESLMQEERLPADAQQTIRHQFHQAARELEEWAHLAAAILAARVGNAAVVTTPHSREPRMRLLELVSVHEHLALLVVVLQEARVLQQMVALEQPLNQDELTAIGRRLNEQVSGKTASEVRANKGELSAIESLLLDTATALLDGADVVGGEPGYVEGLRDLLRQPEFNEGERLIRLLEAMAEHNLSKAIPAPVEAGDVSIIIGGEHPIDEMRACSVISTRYDGPAGLRGTLSVVGPTRMHYPRNVAAVRYMSSLMEELLRVYFA
ncbi:MAG TPA: heat-inducible transcriptional repressor HrcA [Dehalococcoidia bacterium]|nr:heat-inducible transcriptional repressor HrcA [Dehalococcoidia bacterium]